MSKTAQRRRQAYSDGYKLGLYGWKAFPHHHGITMSAVTREDFTRGQRDGVAERARLARLNRSWTRRLARLLRKLWAKLPWRTK